MHMTLEDGRQLSYASYGPEDGFPIIMHHGTPGSRILSDEELYFDLGIRLICPSGFNLADDLVRFVISRGITWRKRSLFFLPVRESPR